jgi:hypothetical protein
VLTASPEVAAWARAPSASFQPGLGFRPHVLGPDDLSVVDSEDMSCSPERAVLGALLAAQGTQRQDALASALRVLGRVDARRAASYLDLLTSILGKDAMPASPETLQRIQEGIQNMHVVHTLIRALKSVMAARGIPFTELGSASLDRCEDPEKVDACIRRAGTATTGVSANLNVALGKGQGVKVLNVGTAMATATHLDYVILYRVDAVDQVNA